MVSNTLVFINCILRVGRDGSSSGDKHVTERVVWALICLAALILGLYFSSMASIRFYEDPSIIHMAKVHLL